MKLLLIVDDYLPHSIKIAAKMMHELALELKKNGHQVSVITPALHQNEKLTIKTIDNIEVLFFRSGEIKNISKTKRAINETLLSFKAWSAAGKYFRKNNCDAVIYYSPSIFWGFLVKKLKSLWKCNSYLILRDIFPQWTVDNGLINTKSPVYWYFKLFEWVNYNSASKIGVMSPSNLDFFRNSVKNISKFEVLYNWSDIPDIKASTGLHRKKLNLEDKVILFYGGNIGHAQKMSILVDLAKQFKNSPNAHFLFVGKGDEVELILNEKKKYNLTNLTYLPSVDQETYFEMLSECDIGLFSLHPDHKTHNFPGKLLGYMAYSKPVLGYVNKGNDLMEIINTARAGVVIDSQTSLGIYHAAKSLIDSEVVRKELGMNGRMLLSEKFSVKNACSQIEKALKS